MVKITPMYSLFHGLKLDEAFVATKTHLVWYRGDAKYVCGVSKEVNDFF